MKVKAKQLKRKKLVYLIQGWADYVLVKRLLNFYRLMITCI